MKKDNLQLLIDNLNRKGIKFTTHTAMHKKLMQNPEFRKLWEADEATAKKPRVNRNSPKSNNLLGMA